MNDTTKAIAIAVAASAAAAVTTALITHYLTKQATIDNVASGKQPLPIGSTPTTGGPAVAQGATPSVAPGTLVQRVQDSAAYAPREDELLQQAVAVSRALAVRG